MENTLRLYSDLAFCFPKKTLSRGRSGLIKSEGPGISGSQLNTRCYAPNILKAGALRTRTSCQEPWGWAKKPPLKVNAVPIMFEKPALLNRKMPAVESQPQKEKISLWETWEIEGKLAIQIPKSLALECFLLFNVNVLTDHWYYNECHHQPQVRW